MNGAFYIGATGLRAQERALGIAANNIANMNTPGFKRSQVRFGELMVTRGDTDDLTRSPLSTPSGVAALATQANFEQGDLRASGSPLDIGIEGEGFIELLGPQGTSLLWRGGTLSTDADGLVTTADGLPLRSLITVPEGASDLRIGRDGTVSARLVGDVALTEIGKIDLVTVRDTGSLEQLSGGLYRLSDDRLATRVVPGEDGAGSILQGTLEASNVALSDEMVTLMLMQRAYAASAQVLQAGDQLMGIANGLRR